MENNPRLSFTSQKFEAEEANRVVFELSYKKAGGQITHLNYTHDQLVNVHKWLSESSFNQIKELCWNLPGPTIFQMLVTIVILKTKSVSAGFQCFFIYNLIPWISIGIISLLASNFLQHESDLSEVGMIIFIGCNSAAAGMLVNSFGTFFFNFLGNWPKMILTLMTTSIFLMYQSPSAIVFCMVFSGLVSLYLETQQTRKKMSQRSQDLFKNLKSNPFLGKTSAVLLMSIFFIMWLFFAIYPEHQYSYIFGFYLVGSLIIGPIESIFAYFLAIFYTQNRFDNFQIWVGLPLSFLLPGTLMNIGIYFGSVIDGFRGAILSGIFIYLPCFLSLLGLLPEWKSYRDRQGIKRLYEGLTCSTTGLTLAIIVLTLKNCMEKDSATSLCIFFVSVCLGLMNSYYSYAVVPLGGFLAYLRYVSVSCYRNGVYCPFPFNF